MFLISCILYVVRVGKGKGRGAAENAVKDAVKGAVEDAVEDAVEVTVKGAVKAVRGGPFEEAVKEALRRRFDWVG